MTVLQFACGVFLGKLAHDAWSNDAYAKILVVFVVAFVVGMLLQWVGVHLKWVERRVL